MTNEAFIPLSDDWNQLKENHLKLSESAAQNYDENYGKDNFATDLYMDFEEEMVKRTVAKVPILRMAVDIGCGTGRETSLISQKFDTVHGYDFAPAMIGQANQKKLKQGLGNVSFQILDVEENPLPHEDNSVDLANLSFGMGSFVKSLDALLCEIDRILKPGAYALFSFYNRNAITVQVSTPWAPALSSKLLDGKNALEVTINGRDEQIGAIAYSVTDVRKILSSKFHVDEIATFPTMSAMLPQTMFEAENSRKILAAVDGYLAFVKDLHYGPYIIAVCKKPGEAGVEGEPKGHAKARQVIDDAGLGDGIVRHPPAYTMATISQYLASNYGVSRAQMLKSVMIEHRAPTIAQDTKMWLLIVQEPFQVDFKKVAHLLDVPRRQLRLVSSEDVLDRTGFEVGAVSPLGLPKNVPVILDNEIQKLNSVWCGTGEPTQSIELPLDELEQLTHAVYGDVAKQKEGE